MNLCRFSLSLLLALHALPGSAAHAKTGEAAELNVLVDDRPPVVELLAGGRLQGSMGSRADAILRASGIRYQLVHASVEEQIVQIRANQQAVCAVGRVLTPERTREGQFSAPFFSSAPYMALVRSDAQWISGPPTLRGWAQNASLRWGIKTGYFYDDYVHARIREAKAQLHPFTIDNHHVDTLLLRKEVDFVLMHQEEIELLLVARPAVGADIMSVRLHDLIGGEFRYFYCSKRVPAQIMEQLNRSIQARQGR